MPSKTNRKITTALIVFLNLTNFSHSAGIASEGQNIAEQWCANCHAVTDEQTSASAAVPSFKYIASKYRLKLNVLGAFLADPHPVMPDLSLTRQEIEDLLAYFGSLE